MRFKKSPRFEFTDTSRKRAALRRKQRLEREALPLFADQIAQTQPSEDQVMHDRAVQSAKHETKDRNYRAEKWREARQILDAMPAGPRRALRRAWNCAPYPADPVYLLGFLRRYRLGEFGLNSLPFALTPADPHGRRLDSLKDQV